MTTLTNLEALAKAVTDPYKDDWELKQALVKFDCAANPETILALIALIKQQHEALNFAADFIPASECKVGECAVCKAIAAYEQFDKGE